MKHPFIVFIAALFILCRFTLYAQTDTKGTDFWVTFGQNYNCSSSEVTLQVRFVGTAGTLINLWFKETNMSQTLTIPAGGVVTYSLTAAEKNATYCQSNGVSNKSIRVTTSAHVTAYAFNSMNSAGSCDATNLLPVPAWGSDYYYLGYAGNACHTNSGRDAYAIIALQDTTKVYQDAVLKSTLNSGQVYYYLENKDINLTGAHITTSKPAALFSLTRIACIPNSSSSGDNLFQQLVSVNTWGKTFLVPKLAKNTMDRIRIVASQAGTVITQTGGTLISGSLTLNAGQWVELQLSLESQGCYIEANKPVAVGQYVNTDASLAWVPALDQSIDCALIAPFIPVGNSWLNMHQCLIITPTAAKNNTTVSIAGGAPKPLSGGIWIDNPVSGYSYYDMGLTNTAASYQYDNKAGIIVFGYGFSTPGTGSSYHYVAGSGVRTLDAAFYVNNIHYQDLSSETVCIQPTHFRAEINGDMSTFSGHLKWYINDLEEVAVQDRLEWSKPLANGAYQVKMEVLLDDDSTTRTVESPLLVSCEPVTEVITICQGDSVLFGKRYYKLEGVYNDTLQTIWGYDSIVSLDLKVNPAYHNFSAYTTICWGDSVSFGNQYYNQTGIYHDTLKTIWGCDSIITLDLTVNDIVRNNIIATICSGDVYTENGFNENRIGVYMQNLTTAHGCDSIVTLYLTMSDTVRNNITATICSGNRYIGRGFNENRAGVYTQNLTTIHGCDSIVTLYLTVNDTVRNNITATICSENRYTENNFNENRTGIYTKNLTTANGCDSIVTLNLTVNDTVRNNIIATICSGNVYTQHGFDKNRTGVYTQNLTTVHGCDSIITLYLTVNDTVQNNISASICSGNRYTDNGFNENLTGVYTKNLTTIKGCDSTVVLNLTVLPRHADTTQIISCESFYTWQNTVYTKDGLHFKKHLNQYGCDSIEYLQLKLNQKDIINIQLSACNFYDWNGTFYTTSGIYKQIFSNRFGCDSVVNLELTVNYPLTSEHEIISCDSYTWNHQTYLHSGDYEQTFLSVNGCDSAVTLHLELRNVELEIVSSVSDFCETMHAVLTAHTNLPEVIWNTGDATASIRIDKPGLYTVTAIEGLCRKTNSVQTPDCNYELFLPNAITPSASKGVNDYYSIHEKYHPYLESVHVLIFNASGKQIYESKNIDFKWDGLDNGELYPNNVYTYMLYVFFRNGNNKIYKGIITVL